MSVRFAGDFKRIYAFFGSQQAARYYTCHFTEENAKVLNRNIVTNILLIQCFCIVSCIWRKCGLFYPSIENKTGLQRVVSTFRSHHWPDEQCNKSGNDPRKALWFCSLIQRLFMYLLESHQLK